MNRQLRKPLLFSFLLHLVIIGGLLILFAVPPEIVITPSARKNEAHMVELFEPAELPEGLPQLETLEPIPPEPEKKLAFRNLSTLALTPTPIPTPTPTATPMPRPTLILTPTPRPTPTPLLRPLPTFTPTRAPYVPKYRRTATPSPTTPPTPRKRRTPEERVAAFDVPRRQAVLPEVTVRPTAISSAARSGGSSRLSSNGASVILDQEDAFPFPDYIAHVEEKIAGLWFPQGTGTVEIFLIIDKNGKILKSGVDKGEGIGVNKLRDSVIRAITLIKRFDPLPSEYSGADLRVRILVRR